MDIPLDRSPDAGTQQAAAVMLQGMTAHYLAFSTYPLSEGDTALKTWINENVGELTQRQLMFIYKRLECEAW